MPLRPSLRLFSLLILLTLPALAADRYNAVYVFGDSYCDVGNIYLASGHKVPLSPPYYQGRFSNGPLWVEHLAGSLGLTLAPELAGGTDYAFGDAEVTAGVPTPEGTIPSIPEQVTLYLKAHNWHADPNALYILEGGGNDILHATGGSPEHLGNEIAEGLANSELQLRQAGARHFLISNLIDISELPAGRANPSFDRAAALAANRDLDRRLRYENDLDDIDILRLDAFSLFHSIFTDPTHFGFTNITTPCLNPATDAVCADPDHTLFWDVEHPTEFGHSIFAAFAEGQLLSADRDHDRDRRDH
jgi:phospholipase/lecithinase/hemolysin